MKPTPEMRAAVAQTLRSLLNSGTPDEGIAGILWDMVAGHVGMLRTPGKWQKEKPAKSGYYWLRLNNSYTEMVYVNPLRETFYVDPLWWSEPVKQTKWEE